MLQPPVLRAAATRSPACPRARSEQAIQRVDNYAAGFIRAGAAAVVAEGHLGPAWYVRQLLTGKGSIESIWNRSPNANGNTFKASSVRSNGFVSRLDPEQPLVRLLPLARVPWRHHRQRPQVRRAGHALERDRRPAARPDARERGPEVRAAHPQHAAHRRDDDRGHDPGLRRQRLRRSRTGRRSACAGIRSCSTRHRLPSRRRSHRSGRIRRDHRTRPRPRRRAPARTRSRARTPARASRPPRTRARRPRRAPAPHQARARARARRRRRRPRPPRSPARRGPRRRACSPCRRSSRPSSPSRPRTPRRERRPASSFRPRRPRSTSSSRSAPDPSWTSPRRPAARAGSRSRSPTRPSPACTASSRRCTRRPGVAYDAATQAMLTPVLVRIGGAIAVAYGAPANLTLNAGMRGVDPGARPQRRLRGAGTCRSRSARATGGDDPTTGYHTSRFPAILTATWVSTDGRPVPAAASTELDATIAAPGGSVAVALDVTAPDSPGEYLLLLDIDLADQRPAVRARQRPGPRPGHGHRGAAGTRRRSRPSAPADDAAAAAAPVPSGASSRTRKPADPPPGLGNTSGDASMDLMGTNVAVVEPIRARPKRGAASASSSSRPRCCPSRRRPTPAPSGSSPPSATSSTARGHARRPRRRRRLGRPVRAHPDRRAEPLVVGLLGRRRDATCSTRSRSRGARRTGSTSSTRTWRTTAFVFAEHCETPVITTLHGRLDAPGLPELLEVASATSRWSRSARASAAGSPTSTGSRRSTTACRSRRCRSRRARRLPRVRGPDHGREGHPGGDRAEPLHAASAPGRRQGHLGQSEQRALRRGGPAGDRRGRDRLSRRGRAARARPAVRRRARDA